MLFINRLLLVGLLSVGITAATTAQAANQLFTMEWFTKSFGNENQNFNGGVDEEWEKYGVFAIPHGLQCNQQNPRCRFDQTPVSAGGDFAPLGGSQDMALFCQNLSTYTTMTGGAPIATVRPAKGDTDFILTPAGKSGFPIPPLYRNAAFFGKPPATPLGPNLTQCTSTSTGQVPGTFTRYGAVKGLVQVGHPVTGSAPAKILTGAKAGGFSFPAADPLDDQHGWLGARTTGLVADFPALYPYVYSYTYATLRNDEGEFWPGGGFGGFTITYNKGAAVLATINVTAGGAKFGGVMRMLGAYTTKVCYYRQGGCLLGPMNWRYDAIGASPYTLAGVVTGGYLAKFTTIYYHTALMQVSTINVVGSRFPWTTGMVKIKATGRGPHDTLHYAEGYDNRAGPDNLGTIQLVTPVLTRWLGSSPAFDLETGGIGILRIRFIPEPQTWAVLVAGVALLGVGTRMRGR